MNGMADEEMRVPGRNFSVHTGHGPQLPPSAAPKRSRSKRATPACAPRMSCTADVHTPGSEGPTSSRPPREDHLKRMAMHGLPIVGPAGSINETGDGALGGAAAE